MKKLSILFCFLTLFTINTSAQWVNLPANCYINGGSVAYCEACNFSYTRPVVCQMNIQGQTSYGFSLQGFQNGWVQSGQCIRGQVYANNPWRDPLVFANAFVNCRF
jgi:hypothetical protein